jgi:hypothetical protein
MRKQSRLEQQHPRMCVEPKATKPSRPSSAKPLKAKPSRAKPSRAKPLNATPKARPAAKSSKAKPKKSQSKRFFSRGVTSVLYTLMLLMVSTAGSYAYFKINAQGNLAAQSEVQRVQEAFAKLPSATVKYVEQHLRKKFIAGEWRYGGIAQAGGLVEAYIQIPQKLEFDKSQQVYYIRHSICPAATDGIWSKLAPQQLEIHLYTQLKSDSTHTTCG